MNRAWLLAAIPALGCGNSTVVLAPVIDGPDGDSAAAAFPDLDLLTVTVAHQGSDDDLVSATFTRGQTIEIPDVPFADDLVIHMDGQVEGSDVAYGRTCAFTLSADGPAPTPHLFFSRSVKFASLGFLPDVRIGGHAVTYHDGSGVLINGMDANGVPVADVERFDPNDGTFSVITQVAPRVASVVSTLGATDGRIAILGGRDTSFVGSSLVELIEVDNPPERRDEPLPPDGQLARVNLTATAIPDGRIIAIGGMSPKQMPVGELDEIVETAGDVEIDPLHATLAVPRAQHTATLLDNDVGASVLIAGGVDVNGAPVPMAELYKSLGDVMASPATFAPNMVVPRSRHQAALLPGGSVLLIGGIDVAGNPVTQLELFSFDAGFVAAGTLPDGVGVVDNTVTTLPDGRILITGGRATVDGPPLDTAFIARLDPSDGTIDVVPTDTLATPRAGHQATLLCDGTVLVSGGTSVPTAPERYNPPATGRR